MSEVNSEQKQIKEAYIDTSFRPSCEQQNSSEKLWYTSLRFAYHELWAEHTTRRKNMKLCARSPFNMPWSHRGWSSGI